MYKIILTTFITSIAFLSGCTTPTADQHLNEVRNNSGEKLTVGTVQRKIRIGMRGAEVIETLGSPNIVSTDEYRREIWVYDKVATETVYSTSDTGGGISALVLGFSTGSPIGGGIGSGISRYKSSGAKSTTQRTLTIIIKFSERGSVRDIAYHSSQF